jgi:hypothetical protein
MSVAWAIGTTMLVVCGSTMHATQASSAVMSETMPAARRDVNGTDVRASGFSAAARRTRGDVPVR